MLSQLQARYKAVIAALGGVLIYLQAVNATNPNHWVSVAIIVLTVLGVHQVSNKSQYDGKTQ